ncbi:PAS domain S-box protein [Aliterella atlantica]|uniref:PAS domain S-box protein n=1 Tax=Aliterella atlantica TaxID=1827278 RepID=UPI0006984210|nr:PAS domain S-box protein [Aliterella atlantica]
MRAPLPENEAARLQALEKYEILDTLAESAFDDLTRLAAYICGVPIALISFVDCDRQWFKSKVGLERSQTHRDVSFCAHGILQSDILIVRDTLQDERFANNPLVIGEPYIRFYAGAPLIDADGFALGTLCIIDKVPRDLSIEQQQALATVSRQVVTQLELRRNVVKLQEAIEQYQQADEARQKSEQKLALHFRQTPVAVIEWDLNFAIVDWNQAAEKIFGYSRNEAINRHAAGLLVPPSAREEVDRVMVELLAQKGGTHNINPNLTKDGRAIICEWYNTPLINDRQEVVGVASIAQDITARFLAEKALQKSEAKYRLVVNRTKEVIFETDAIGLWRFLNPAWQQITGFSVDDTIGNDFFEYIHPQERQESIQQFQALLQNRAEFYRHEARYLTSDGGYRWLELSACPLLDEKGAILGSCGTLQDISDRKLAQVALQKSERLFKAVFDNAFQFIGLLTPDGAISTVNQTALDFGGITLESVVGQLFWETLWWRHSSAEQEKLKAAIFQAATGKLIRYEVDVIGAGDTISSIDFSIKPVLDEIGQVSLLILEGRDITKRQQAEKALQSSLATNRALINALPDLMFRISGEGIFINYKAGKGNELLLPASEFLGKSIYEVMPQVVAQTAMKCIQQALATKDVQIFEYQLPADKNIIYCEARIAVSAEDEVMVIVRDITARKLAEAEIRNALATEKHLGELKSRFITMASHEFRTPLTTILSSAELLEDFGESWSQQKQHQHLHRIQTNVKHMTELLEDVMLIGKAEMGKLNCHPLLMDVVQFCRDLVNEMLVSCGYSHDVVFTSPANSLDAYLDDKLLRPILSNLLANAIKYSPAGSSIHFELNCQEKAINFQIQDRGIGIPASEQAHLFDSFYRASNVGNISGTGLGLAIVKKAVDLHQGTITVKSEVGVGTTFLISIPLIKEIYEQDFSN